MHLLSWPPSTLRAMTTGAGMVEDPAETPGMQVVAKCGMDATRETVHKYPERFNVPPSDLDSITCQDKHGDTIMQDQHRMVFECEKVCRCHARRCACLLFASQSHRVCTQFWRLRAQLEPVHLSRYHQTWVANRDRPDQSGACRGASCTCIIQPARAECSTSCRPRPQGGANWNR